MGDSVLSRIMEKDAESSTSSIFKTKHLQELLLLQLELIQEQQRRLAMKDKHIITLKTERDQLEARLNRMERRINIQKRHTLDSDGASRLQSPALRGSYFNLQPPQKKDQAKVQQTKQLNFGAPITVSSRQDKEFQYHNHLNTNSAFLDDAKMKLNISKSVIAKESYGGGHVSVPLFTAINSKTTELKNEKLKTTENKPEDSCEDITDDAYLKRHSRPEQEEKRRKRWDLQVLRQQRQRDALVQKYQDKQGKLSTTTTTLSKEKVDQKANAPPLIDSLYKKPDNAMAIEIGDFVPVCAFGSELAAAKQRDFDLPWFSVARREIQLREAKQKMIKKQQQKQLRRKSGKLKV